MSSEYSEGDLDIPVAGRSIPKVCIVFQGGRLGVDECIVFVLDLSHHYGGGGRGGDTGSTSTGSTSSNEFPRCPTLRFDSMVFSNWNFCVIGSIFYAFEGNAAFGGNEGRGIFKFQLPLYDDETDIKLDRSMLSCVCEMKNSKIHPSAVASPDGKYIVVFSSSFIKSDKFAFELFDTMKQSCSRLPRIPLAWIPGTISSSDSYFPRSLTFISGRVFLMEMDFGLLSLDIGGRLPHWKLLKNFYGGVYPTHSYIVKGNDLCLTPSVAYNIMGLDCCCGDGQILYETSYDSVFRWPYFYPNSSELPNDYKYPTESVTLLEGDDQDNDFSFCTLKAGQNADSKHVHIFLDLYRCNLDQCREIFISNREKEEEDKQLKMNLINELYEKEERGGYDLGRWSEYSRKRGDILGKRQFCLLPGASRERLLKFYMAQQYEYFFLLSFASIPIPG